jgi:hypothetical protein
MDAVLAARMRRQAPLTAAFVACALFLIVHTLVFQPRAARYRAVIAEAAKVGLVVDPSRPGERQPMPVRVFTLLIGNSLSPAEADARTQSGTLGAAMAQTLSSMAARRGLEIVVAEPGVLSQLPGSIEIRAHLRLRGSYGAFVGLVDDLARSDRLWLIERFAIVQAAPGRDDFEVWMASCLLKRTGSGS